MNRFDRSIVCGLVLGVLAGRSVAGDPPAATPADATFHFMAIEKLIGGIGGDATAQVVQLQLRSAAQNFTNGTEIAAFDAAGGNRVLLATLTDVTNGLQGDRILLATPSVADFVDGPFNPDFVMTPMPESYLTAGRVVYDDPGGFGILFSVAWGPYTGSNTGSTFNDDNGDYGPPFATPLSDLIDAVEALDWIREPPAKHQQNTIDYVVQTAVVLTNNAHEDFEIVLPPACPTLVLESAASIRSHAGFGELPIDIDLTATIPSESDLVTSETRAGDLGIEKIRVTASGGDPTEACVSVTVVDDLGAEHPPSSVTFGTGEMDLNFDPNLPNRRVYTVTLGGVIDGDGDFQVRSLVGDVVQDAPAGPQTVNAIDIGLSGLRGRFNQPVDNPANTSADINMDGVINALDVSCVRLVCGVWATTAP